MKVKISYCNWKDCAMVSGGSSKEKVQVPKEQLKTVSGDIIYKQDAKVVSLKAKQRCNRLKICFSLFQAQTDYLRTKRRNQCSIGSTAKPAQKSFEVGAFDNAKTRGGPDSDGNSPLHA